MTPEQEKLATENQKLVPHIARQFSQSQEITAELIGEGIIALVEASQKYDETKGKFQTYAGKIIRNRMKKFLVNDPKNMVSFESVFNSEGLPLSETLPDPDYEHVEDQIIKMENSKDLAKAILLLNPREAWIIRRHYGLDGFDPMTLQELGDYIGVSKQYVNQLHQESLEFLQNYMKKT